MCARRGGSAQRSVPPVRRGVPGRGRECVAPFARHRNEYRWRFHRGRILDGVIQQISDGDAQQAGIGLQLRAFHRAVLADVQVVIMGDGHHRGGHVDHRQQGGLLALDVQIVGGEPGVGKAVIGELHQAGGGAADAIEARLLAGRGRREAKILQRRLDHR